MPFGPCGDEFKQKHSAASITVQQRRREWIVYHMQFRAMQECFLNHPEEYGKYSEDEGEEESGEQEGESSEMEGGSKEQERGSKEEESSSTDNAVSQQPASLSPAESPITASLTH